MNNNENFSHWGKIVLFYTYCLLTGQERNTICENIFLDKKEIPREL